jgi:hypothetical protein
VSRNRDNNGHDNGIGSGEYREVHTEVVHMPLEQQALDNTGVNEEWVRGLGRDETVIQSPIDDTTVDNRISEADAYAREKLGTLARGTMETAFVNNERNVNGLTRDDVFKPQHPNAERLQHDFPAQPQFQPGQIDIADYVKAQNKFLEVQTWFLEQKAGDIPQYTQALTAYSKAQRDFIRSQATILHQLGVI